jgi:hypothetical protein
LLKKSFSGVGDPPLTSPRRRSRDVAYNVPTEERGIGRRGSWIYLSLHFSAMGVPEILTFSAFYQQKASTFGHPNQILCFYMSMLL